MASKPKSRLSVFRHRRTSDGSLQAANNINNNNNHIGINEKTNYGGNSARGRRAQPGVNSDNKTDDSDDSNKFTDDEERTTGGIHESKQAVRHQRNQEGNFDRAMNKEGYEEEEDFELEPLPERDERFWYSANDISLSQLSHNVTKNALSTPTHQHQQHQRHHHHRKESSSSSSLSSTEAITREKRLAKALLHLHIQAAENVVASTNAKQRHATQKNDQLLSSKKGGNKESGHDDHPHNPSTPAITTMTKTTKRRKSRNAIGAALVDSQTTVNPSRRTSKVHMNPNGGQHDEDEDDNWGNESPTQHCCPILQGPKNPHHHQFDEESTIEIKLSPSSSSSSSSSSHEKANDQSSKKSQSKTAGMKLKTSKPILLHYHHNRLEETEEANSLKQIRPNPEDKKNQKRGRSLSLPEKIWNDLLGRSNRNQKRHSTIDSALEDADLQAEPNELNQDQDFSQNSKFRNNTYRLSAPTFPLPPPIAFSDMSMDSIVSMSTIVQPEEPEIKRERNRWNLFSFRRKSKRSPSLTNPRDHVILANSILVREKPDKVRRSSIAKRRPSLKENRKLSGIERDFGKNNNNCKRRLSNLHVSTEVIPGGTQVETEGDGNGTNGGGDDGGLERRRMDCEIVNMDLDQGPGLSKKSSGAGFLKSFRLKKNKVSSSSGSTDADKVSAVSASADSGGDGCFGVGSGENDKKAAEINVNVRNKKGIGTGIGADDKEDGTDDNNKSKFRRFPSSSKKTKKSKSKKNKGDKKELGSDEEGRKTSANIFQAFYYAGRRHESVTAKDFDDVTLDLASGELKKTQDGTVIVENATRADVDIVPGPQIFSRMAQALAASGAGNSRPVKEIAHDVANIHNDDDDDPHGQNLRVREILGNHRGGFRPSNNVAAIASKTASSRVSSITNGIPSAIVTTTSMAKKQDPGNNSTPLYASPLKKNKNQSEDDVSSIIPTSSTLVTQQLLTFDGGNQESQNFTSQTEALVHHYRGEDEERTGDEEDDSMSQSPPKSLLGRVKDFHRNGVFGFGSPTGSNGSSPSPRSTHKSSSSTNYSRSNSHQKDANQISGHNGSSTSSSNDFYGSTNNASTCNRDNLAGQSYQMEEEEDDDLEKNDVRNSGKNDRGSGGRTHRAAMARSLSNRNDELLNNGRISGGSEEESRKNSSEEELTSINNVSVVRASTSAPTTTTTVTTSVTMALPPTRRSNLLNSSGACSLSDCSSTSTPAASMEDYNGPFVGKAIALVDCTPSPYDRHALRYKKGDVIQIISKKPTGSWTGKVNNQVGHFKFINVQVLPDDEDDVFDMEYEGDYSRDEDYYYNNCTRGGGGYESDTHSNVSSIRRRNRHHRKASLMTPWELEQRQTVASVINGIRKENKALRRESSQGTLSSVPSQSAASPEGPQSGPPHWNDTEVDSRGGSGKFSDSSLTKLTGIPAVKRTSSSRRGERSTRSSSSKQKKEKKGRPKSVGDLLQRIHLQEYISVFILHGFESLDLFKELEEEDLDRLAILNEADRAKILTAVEFLRDYDTEEEIPIPMLSPPTPPSHPPPSSSATSSSGEASTSDNSRTFPRDSGIFVKCDEDGDGDIENGPDGLPSSMFFEQSGQNHGKSSVEAFMSSSDASGERNFSLMQQNANEFNSERNPMAMRESNLRNVTESSASTGGGDEELILSPLNLQKMQLGAPTLPYTRSTPQTADSGVETRQHGKAQADLFGDVKQRFLNAKSMFEMASTTTATTTGTNGNSVSTNVRECSNGKNNRFSHEKSSDSGISCSANSPPLTQTDY